MSTWSKIPGREWLALAVILCTAFVLRARDVQAFRLSPDDGNYLNSARVQTLERGGTPWKWIKDDVAWVKELADNYQDEIGTYQHSYLHQWTARCLYRLGFDSVTALRANSVLFGTLSVAALYWIYARLFPRRRTQGLLAALVLALLPVHAWYSRAGWGVIGCTFFWLIYLTLAYEMCAAPSAAPRRHFLHWGIGLALATICAYGYHEMIAPYVVAMGVAVALTPWLGFDALRDESNFAQRVVSVVRSSKTWTYVASAIPVGAATLGVYLFSDFAKKLWFDLASERPPYWTMRRKALENLLPIGSGETPSQRVDLQLTYAVLCFALLGAIALWRTQRAFLKFILVNVLVGTLLLFFKYRDPNLVRIYMPLILVLALLAAEGAAFLIACARTSATRTIAVAGVACFVLYLSAISWFSLFGPLEHPFFNRYYYVTTRSELLEPRHVDEHLLAYLQQHMQPGEHVYTFCDKSPVFRLLDVGIPSREFVFEEPREDWPEWILGAARLMDRDQHSTKAGGNYRLIDIDKAGRIALYRRDDAH